MPLRPPNRRRTIALRDLVLTERVKSREMTEVSGRRTIDFEYDLTGTSSEQMAHNFLLLKTPRTYEGLFRMEAKVSPIIVDEKTDTGRWRCDVRYATGEVVPRNLTDSSFTFDTTGGTTHITNSKFTVSRVKEGNTLAANHYRAIRVEEDRVVGTDIPSPVYSFTESHIFPDVDVSSFYKGILFTLTGRMNFHPFKGFNTGECLFLGAFGAQRGIGAWNINFRFLASPTTHNLKFGHPTDPNRQITIVEKLGQDFLWIKYRHSVDEEAHELVMVPKAVYVERVHDFGNFAALRIGT